MDGSTIGLLQIDLSANTLTLCDSHVVSDYSFRSMAWNEDGTKAVAGGDKEASVVVSFNPSTKKIPILNHKSRTTTDNYESIVNIRGDLYLAS